MDYMDGSMSNDERELLLQEHISKLRDLMAFHAGSAERRRDPSIGYGTLFDDDDDQRHDYTLAIDIALPDFETSNCISQLEEMVEATVKMWLTHYAPTGTRTNLVEAIQE